MKAETYVGRVMKKVGLLPKPLKQQIKNDVENSVASRLENGEAMESIEAEMGTPSQIAAELFAGFRPEFKRGISLLRYVYLLFAIIPLLYVAFVAANIFATPSPGGFTSHAAFFRDLFSNHSGTMARLAVNGILHLLVCSFGYIAYSRQMLLSKNSAMGMFCLSLIFGIVLHPAVYGVDALQVICSLMGVTVPSYDSILWNSLQPQVLLALYTAIVLLLLYIRRGKQPPKAVPIEEY